MGMHPFRQIVQFKMAFKPANQIRTEVRMMSPIILAQGKKRNARKLLQALYRAKANIIPEDQAKSLRVQVLGLGSTGLDQALNGLFSELNGLGATYPGTELRMIYELAN